jgi:hypothetical protein
MTRAPHVGHASAPRRSRARRVGSDGVSAPRGSRRRPNVNRLSAPRRSRARRVGSDGVSAPRGSRRPWRRSKMATTKRGPSNRGLHEKCEWSPKRSDARTCVGGSSGARRPGRSTVCCRRHGGATCAEPWGGSLRAAAFGFPPWLPHLRPPCPWRHRSAVRRRLSDGERRRVPGRTAPLELEATTLAPDNWPCSCGCTEFKQEAR